LRANYNLGDPAIPLAIILPQSADDDAKLVKHALSNEVKFVARSGGHDMKDKLHARHRVRGDRTREVIGREILTLPLETQLAQKKG
jgi:hypothetical protein